MRYFSRNIFTHTVTSAALALGIGLSTTAVEGADPTHDKALVIVDKAILKQSDLTFGNTLKHILRGDRPVEDVTDAATEQFLQTLLASFGETNFPGMPLAMSVRSSQPLANLQPQNLLDSRDTDEGGSPYALRPSAVFFRPDLAPKNFKDCGEFRIVYSFEKPVSEHPDGGTSERGLVKRFFLIFETRPSFPYGGQMKDLEAEGFAACQTLAQKWASFRSASSAPITEEKKTEIAAALNTFFYDTMHETGTGKFRRAMHADYLAGNFRTPLGQVRGNFLTTEVDQDGTYEEVWQLREWLVGSGPSGVMQFNAAPTEDSPIAALYKNARGPDSMEARFKNHLFDNLAHQLSKPKIIPTIADIPQCSLYRKGDSKSDQKKRLEAYLVNALGVKNFDRAFLSYADVSRPDPLKDLFEEAPPDFADTRKRAAIFAGGPNGPKDHTMDWYNLLKRAQALSCAGCHHTTPGLAIGKIGKESLKWPISINEFVHVLEPEPGIFKDYTRLSNAVTNVFLKFRTCVLDSLLAGTPADFTISTFSRASEVDLQKDRIISLRSEISDAERTGQRTAEPDEFFAKVLELRRALQSEAGAFVEHRRSH